MPQSLPQSWQPILRDTLAESAWAAVEEIADALDRARQMCGSPSEAYPVRALNSPALAWGSSGAALFFAYLDQARPGRGHAETAVELLEMAIEQMSRSRLDLGLFEGVLSTAWVAQHLAGRVFDPAEGEDFNEEIDTLTRDVLAAGFHGDYDLIAGLVGIGVYVIERLPRPMARQCLGALVSDLESRAENKPSGVTWWTPPNPLIRIESEIPRGHYNLGVAHGIPGVIGFLARLAAAGLECDRVLPLLEGAVDWLLDLELEDHEVSFFCDRLVPGAELHPTRTGWCYGDPGIVAVLLGAARAAKRPDWEEKALAIAHEVSRRPFETTGVLDGGLCHGTAGVAHVFNRLYQATGEARFREAAVEWFRRNDKMRRPGEGFGGYSMWTRIRGEVIWQDDPGFLAGAAGIGLALLAALTPVEPAWDRVMLLTIPEADLATDTSDR